MEKLNYKKALEAVGVSYIGSTRQSAKMLYSYRAGTLTYCIYLAPWNLSGHQVCPGGKNCHEHCLYGSGQNKAQILGGISTARDSRIKKTKFFYENRELFTAIVAHEIRRARKYAERKGLHFSVRLNGTSDLSPEAFTLGGKNILEIFPDVQFYDYTKVPQRLSLLKKYTNYDLTFSFDGYNWSQCEKFLDSGGKVAVVFWENLPKIFKGYDVIDANGYDMRYIDPAGTICGLHYHRTAADYKSGKFVMPDTKFVVSA